MLGLTVLQPPYCHNFNPAKIEFKRRFYFSDIPALQKHRFPLFIDDAEPAVHLAVRMQAPNLVSRLLKFE
jgi:hypothetical protein